MEDNTTQSVNTDAQTKNKPKSIKVNFVYSLLNKLVAVLVPLLITPYLARVLEPDGNGVISFVLSISSYFILVANLGIETYGQRVIAIHREDKEYLKKFFLEISILRLVITAFCIAVYCIIFFVVFKTDNITLYLIFGLTVLACVFDYSWFFQGVEDFRTLAFANIITRIIYIAGVFIFVKVKTDLNIAALLSAINTVLPFFITLPFLHKYLRGKIIEKIKPFGHFKECMVYFIPTVAVQIYTVLDKTMIGLITGSDFENGYYEQAEKIVKLPLTVIYTLNTIIRSRISFYYAKNEMDKIKDLIYKSANFTFAFSLPVMAGLFAVASKFIPIYLGDGYEKCIMLMYIFAPIILFISISNLAGTNYFTPFGKQKTSNILLIIGAGINLVLNSVLIYFFQSIGAAIASVCSEFVVMLLYVIFARNIISVKKLLGISVKYLISSAVMFAGVFTMDYFLPSTIWYLLLEIGSGIIIYFVMLLLLKTEFVYSYIKIYRDKIVGKFSKNKQNENQTDSESISDKDKDE